MHFEETGFLVVHAGVDRRHELINRIRDGSEHGALLSMVEKMQEGDRICLRICYVAINDQVRKI